MPTILLKKSDTPGSVPGTANLTNLAGGVEVAVNTADKRVYSMTSASAVIELGTNPSSLTCSDVSATVLRAGSATITNLITTNDATIDGMAVGQGGGNVASNTAVGVSALAANTTGVQQVAIGACALCANTTGAWNTAVGFGTLSASNGEGNTALGRVALSANTSGLYNTGLGFAALNTNTSGSNNTALGGGALQSNTTASNNVAVGYQAAFSNTTGTANVALGLESLYSNTTGNSNTAIGRAALRTATTATGNTAVGLDAGRDTTGADNAILGWSAMRFNSTGANNTAVGSAALFNNTTASNNTAVGYQAGFSNITGAQNTYIGRLSGQCTTGTGNTFVGNSSGYLVTSGGSNTFLGQYSGNQDGLNTTTSSNYVVISDGAGNRQLSMYEGGTVALDSAVPVAGTGITFPATQSASSDANTLDDYEEGTWTPDLQFGGAKVGITYTTQAANYTKIGRQVYCTARITLSNKGSSSGNATIAGLPFTVLNSTGSFGAAAIGFINSSSANFGNQTQTWVADYNTTIIQIRYVDTVGNYAAHTDTAFTNTTDFIFNLYYSV